MDGYHQVQDHSNVMDIRKNMTSIRLYSIGLISAIVLLLITLGISFRQVKNLEKSADLVNHSMMVDKEINRMFSNYSMLKSSQLDYVVSKNDVALVLLKNYKEQSENALQRLKQLTVNDKEQQKKIERMTALKSDFMGQLDALNKIRKDSMTSDANLSERMAKITDVMERMRTLKDEMISKEEMTKKLNEDTYRSSTNITPLTILGIALISTLIFALTFWKIIKNKREIVRTKAFLDNILQSTDNVISHYKPVRDEKHEIIDFTVLYINDPITAVTGERPEEILGMHISKLYPFLFENGFFEMLKDCVNKDEVLHLEREYEFLGKKKSFRTTAIKLGDAVTITSINVTDLKLATKNLEDINKQLSIKNNALNEAEVMAGLGSYRYDAGTEEAQISDNYYRLLDLQPNEIKLTREKFATFIHPDDIEGFDNWMEKILATKQGTEFSFRIISKDHIEKTLNYKLNHSIENGKVILIGVVQDITQDIQRKAHLEDQNIELTRSNEELGSFNHVVSHDLQEPLRKIQMFISLIHENGQPSDENKAYFEKIETAAYRMQTLIKHLLTYSRLGKDNQVFKTVNLNKTLEKVEDNQSDLIAERQVKLTIKQMPTVHAIPFQMEQLFTNLIINALKYSNTDEPSKILITSEVVHRSQIHEAFRKKHTNYHRISVIDNGIGFHQEHSEKIFELFQRLHQSDHYTGTGLGLAICKKIMENHDGYISAMGEEGKGATFVVYLPEE